jgi:hypothetical protein
MLPDGAGTSDRPSIPDDQGGSDTGAALPADNPVITADPGPVGGCGAFWLAAGNLCERAAHRSRMQSAGAPGRGSTAACRDDGPLRQRGSAPGGRLAVEIAGALTIPDPSHMKDRWILVLDDVFTIGYTP